MAQSWFIVRGESRLGPFTHRGLVTLAGNGELSETDLVWCSDMQTPMEAACVAGIFEEPEEPVEVILQPPSASAQFPEPASVENLFTAPKKDRFAALFEAEEDEDDLADEQAEEGADPEIPEEDDDDADEQDEEAAEPVVPTLGRTPRRIAPRRKTDQSSTLLIIGGLAILGVVLLIVVLEQTRSGPTKPPATTRTVPPPAPVPPPTPPAPPRVVSRPERPPPPPPKFDSQPLLEETTKATVTAVLESNPSIHPRYRQLWESQLLTLLTQETKRMRGEEEVRGAVTRISASWAKETQSYIATELAPKPAPEPERELGAGLAMEPVAGEDMEPADGDATDPAAGEDTEPAGDDAIDPE